jgi:hypothetical protein
MKRRKVAVSALIAGIIVLLAAACGGETTASQFSPTFRYALYDHADVIDVSISGVPGDYSVSVTVSSDDRGCESYVDWWEVISEEGELLTRRVLLHAHVEEQPFTRNAGGLKVRPGERLIIRAHMNDAGYGSTVMRGSVADGFQRGELSVDFAADLETQRPLPTGCAF